MGASEGEIIRVIRIEASPADVFPYFVDAHKLVAWKAVNAEVDATPGGMFRLDITGRGDVAIGSYVEIDPPRRVVFTWAWEGDDPSVTRPGVVEVTLTPEGQGTVLRLVHRGLAPDRQGGSAQGWDHYLARLVLVAGGEDPGRDPWAGRDASGSRIEEEAS
jgi:uncharacterized protein YndB with AHSA1/START domain